MASDTKENPVCPECGSTEILIDAWASWDGSEFTLTTIFENGFCESCEESFKHVHWKKEK